MSFSLPSSSKMVSHDPNSKPPCSTHSTGKRAKLPSSWGSSPGSLWVGRLLVRIWRMEMRSEVACRANSNWQGLPLVFVPWRRTQGNYSQRGAGEGSCLTEWVGAGLDRWGWEDCCHPSKEKGWKPELGEDNLMGLHRTSDQAFCLSGNVGTRAGNSIHCDPKLNDPKEKSCLGLVSDGGTELPVRLSRDFRELVGNIRSVPLNKPSASFSSTFPQTGTVI